MPAGVSAWTPLANITLGSATNSVTFSSISQSYKDLRLVISGGIPSDNASFRLNGDAASVCRGVTIEGNGSSAASATFGNTGLGYFGFSYILWYSSSGVVVTMDLLDYSATDKHKTILTRGNNSANAVNAVALRWPTTTAVTSIRLDANGSNWSSGTSFALYGVSV
jgi:hypothetical protein